MTPAASALDVSRSLAPSHSNSQAKCAARPIRPCLYVTTRIPNHPIHTIELSIERQIRKASSPRNRIRKEKVRAKRLVSNRPKTTTIETDVPRSSVNYPQTSREPQNRCIKWEFFALCHILPREYIMCNCMTNIGNLFTLCLII